MRRQPAPMIRYIKTRSNWTNENSQFANIHFAETGGSAGRVSLCIYNNGQVNFLLILADLSIVYAFRQNLGKEQVFKQITTTGLNWVSIVDKSINKHQIRVLKIIAIIVYSLVWRIIKGLPISPFPSDSCVQLLYWIKLAYYNDIIQVSRCRCLMNI